MQSCRVRIRTQCLKMLQSQAMCPQQWPLMLTMLEQISRRIQLVKPLLVKAVRMTSLNR